MRGICKPRYVLLAVALLAMAMSACGGDEGSGSSAAEVQRQAQAEANAEVEARNAEVMEEYRKRQAAQAPTEEEVQAKQTATDFYEILEKEKGGNPNRTTLDSTSFCDLMSEEAVAQTIHYAKVSSGIARKWDCESAIELLVLRSKRTGGFKNVKEAEVIGVNAQGDRATATIRFGDGPATSIPLVREDGEWKLGSSALGQ